MLNSHFEAGARIATETAPDHSRRQRLGHGIRFARIAARDSCSQTVPKLVPKLFWTPREPLENSIKNGWRDIHHV